MADKLRKIVLTGGHAGTTALAVIEELQKRGGWEIYWIGTKRAMEGKDTETLEFKVFPRFQVAYHPIIAGRLQRKWTRHTIPSLIKLPIGFFQSFFILTKIKPEIILSFGGFAAFPVVVSAWLLGKPIIIHEQTAAVGLANKLSAFFATKIALARKESREFFPLRKTVLTGNPLMCPVTQISPKNKLADPPLIFVTCGSRGAQVVNQAVEKALPDLLKDFRIVHQTGELDFDHFNQLKRNLKLKEDLIKRYQVLSFIDPFEMASYYEKADLVIARAGANTVSEIMAAGRPAILIPIPWVSYDEQNRNALIAKKQGVAEIIQQSDLTPENLFEKIQSLRTNWPEIVRKRKSDLVKLDKQASRKLVDLIETLVK